MTTVTENSELAIVEFGQKAFSGSRTTLNELEAEPTNSNVKLQLAYEDMVLNVKKLNPGSSFDRFPSRGCRYPGHCHSPGRCDRPRHRPSLGWCTSRRRCVTFADPSGITVDVVAGQGTESTSDTSGQQVGTTTIISVPADVASNIESLSLDKAAEAVNFTVADIATAIQEAAKISPNNREQPSSDSDKEEDEGRQWNS